MALNLKVEVTAPTTSVDVTLDVPVALSFRTRTRRSNLDEGILGNDGKGMLN